MFSSGSTGPIDMNQELASPVEDNMMVASDKVTLFSSIRDYLRDYLRLALCLCFLLLL